MLQTLINAWKIKDLRMKILYTIFIILVFRIGAQITVPYVNQDVVAAVLNGSDNVFFGYVNMLTGGAFSNATIFAMSITPYINASIIIQLLCIAIPALERMVKEGGPEGQKKQMALTRYTTVALGLLQGLVYYITLSGNGMFVTNAAGVKEYVIQNPNLWKAIVIILSFTAGTAMVMWLGEKITEKGIGNGISVILFAGILAQVPSVAVTAYQNVKNGSLPVWLLALLLAFMIVAIAFVVFFNNAERRIPVNYAKRVVGRKVYGGQTSYIPMKVAMTGVMPIIFASSITSLPMIIFAFLPEFESGSFWAVVKAWTSTQKPLYPIIYFLLIVAFSFFYAYTQFNPLEVANNIKNNGGTVPGIRQGRPTADYISKILKRLTLIGAFFLGVVAIVPILMSYGSQTLGGLALGGTTLLIVVGVALDTVKTLEAQMMMRHYKGFLE